MYCVKSITKDMYWVGGSDRRLSLFENAFPIPRGISYNAYVVLDEKTVLLDTVDQAIGNLFLENLSHVLAGRPLDYVIVNHVEPDHCAMLEQLLGRYPALQIVGNAKTIKMLQQFFDFDVDAHAVTIAEGGTLCTGRHTFTFYMAPMVHWPETMVTYDPADKVLYSADAFGTFGAINGNLFADEVDFEGEWLPDARRYYANICGKYGLQVQALLKKAQALDIQLLCPLHGPVWRENIGWYVDKYQKWSTYTPEENAVMIAYASVYGHTENVANILASLLAEAGIKRIAMYDVSGTDPSVIVSESFRCSHLVFASTTYNAGIFCNMETALLDLKAHQLRNRTVALIENGSWGPMSGKLMRELFCSMKNMTVLDETMTLKSAMKTDQMEQLRAIAKAIVHSMHAAD